MTSLINRLPTPRGRLTLNAPLAPLTWLRVGGAAEALFLPEDADDLAQMLAGTPEDIPVTIIGVGSNLLVRDGGISGLVIRLGRGFNGVEILPEGLVSAGAAALDSRVAQAAAAAGIGGLEFLRGVPGSIGGALRMNAGCYGTEVKDRLAAAHMVLRDGRQISLSPEELSFAYRSASPPPGSVFVGALFQGVPEDPNTVTERMTALVARREASQPVREKTGGSTFRNPAGHSTVDGSHMPLAAWRLIDDAGCRGLRMGGAMVSDKHTNFLINADSATAADLENLGEEVRRRVRETSGHDLVWEIKRIGLL